MLSFPQNFLWGAATAAQQVEGQNFNSDISTAIGRRGNNCRTKSKTMIRRAWRAIGGMAHGAAILSAHKIWG
ncbi:glycosyl hydrolase family protein [Anaerolineae bacterium CFX7]|nr:glycosyl hydrolase family protein [Anaerolineae bacterium CFX7]